MRRSSRILGFLIMATMAPTVAEARGFGFRGGVGPGGRPFMMGRPFAGVPRPAIRPGVRAGFPGLQRRFGRFGRGYGFGGFGLDGGGLDLADLGLGTLRYGDTLPPEGGDGPPPRFIPIVVPPPVCPMIIAVGAGLRHPARTRVVYGRQPFCRR